MTLDSRLLQLLVCPVCKGPLQASHDEAGRLWELICPADRLGFPVRDGIPTLLEGEARSLELKPEPATSTPDTAAAPSGGVAS